jgi:hypothetical protein
VVDLTQCTSPSEQRPSISTTPPSKSKDTAEAMKGVTADQAVLAAVMEETGGLGVDAVIDLQYVHDEYNFMQTRIRQLAIEPTAAELSSAAPSPPEATSSSPTPDGSPSSSSSSSDVVSSLASTLLPTPPSSLAQALLAPSQVTAATLIQCLAVHGRLVTSTPSLQLDPPLARQLYLRSGSLSFLFPQSWILASVRRGTLAAVVAEVCKLAQQGLLQPVIHSRYPLAKVGDAFRMLSQAFVGKVVVFMTATTTMSGQPGARSAQPTVGTPARAQRTSTSASSQQPSAITSPQPTALDEEMMP